MKKPVKAAVIGYGHLGKWHAQKCDLLDCCELKAIVDHGEQKRKKAQESHPHALIARDIEEVIEEVDAFIIVTPTSSHFSLAQKGLQQGISIFCEKPLCQSLSQALELCSLAQEKESVIFQVGHSERFQKAWELIKNHPVLGKKRKAIRIERTAPFKGRATDVDVVQDLMSHDLDILLHVLGEYPTKIEARGFKIKTKHWDHVDCFFSLKDGSKAMITASRNHVFEKRNVEIIGEKGIVHVDLFSHKIVTIDEEKNHVKETSYEKRDLLLEEQKEFFHCIQEKKAPSVSIFQAKEVVFLQEKILECLESRKAIEL